jgi:hypothetical protein
MRTVQHRGLYLAQHPQIDASSYSNVLISDGTVHLFMRKE